MTRQFSAGGAVYQKRGQETFWLVSKPKPSSAFPKERYQLPKGLINQGETSKEAAVREVAEETGVSAKVVSKIGTSKYFLTIGVNQYFKIATWFLMEYVSGEAHADNVETEKVLWLPYPEAKKMLTYSSERGILEKSASLI